jgi:hypothetical protein
MRLLGQDNEGRWILRADFKSPTVDNEVWFRIDPAAPQDQQDVMPVRGETVRGTPGNPDDLSSLFNLPDCQATLAMNLLSVRRWPEATQALRGHPREVDYPCEIKQAYPLITAAPQYQKHHDLHPTVMLTGVACLSTDGGKNPMMATSFGLNDPATEGATSYEDFIDFSHPKDVEYGDFALTYPATWFLRVQAPGTEEVEQSRYLAHTGFRHVPIPDWVGTEEVKRSSYRAQVGGVTCAATLSVQVHAGTPGSLAGEYEGTLSRLAGPLTGPMGWLSPCAGEAFPLLPGAQAFAFDLDNPRIDGLSYMGIYRPSNGDRFAQLNAFGCISKGNPRRGPTLNEMRSTFREIVGSFRFI